MKKIFLIFSLALMPAFSFAGGGATFSEHLLITDELMQEEGSQEIISDPLARLQITDELMQEEGNDTDNQTVNDALMLAVEQNQPEVIQYLGANGVDLHAEQDAAFRLACKYGYTSLAQLFLSYGANMHAVYDDAFLNAAHNGHADTVQFLINQGRITEQGEIPYEYINQAFIDTVNGAKGYGAPTKHIDTLNILLVAGANIHRDNDRALRNAIDNGNDAIIDFIHANSDSY